MTQIVGPPGTGKTDVAVQLLATLHASAPGERTLLITHSNAALNDLFEKLVARDVPAGRLLRLGAGEAELAAADDFSRGGRVDALLARRLELLAEAERVARCLGVPAAAFGGGGDGGGAPTCAAAEGLFALHVRPAWLTFRAARRAGGDGGALPPFPFASYFETGGRGAPVLWGRGSRRGDRRRGVAVAPLALHRARRPAPPRTPQDRRRPGALPADDAGPHRGHDVHARRDQAGRVFGAGVEVSVGKEKRGGERARFFVFFYFCLTNPPPSPTHPPLPPRYDNVVMEEAGQVLEIETAIPLLLQRAGADGASPLKRVILIGDHNQLPPVVKNAALARGCGLAQSLFARLVRLGTPGVTLDAQGRARPPLAVLYAWRYPALANLPRVMPVGGAPEYRVANAGMARVAQFVDVPDFNGAGETSPLPHYYQNLGEAELVVSLYQYLRLRGWPAESMALLTTYNGQRDLLADVVEARCAHHPAFGRPAAVSTVDKFQGQQADIVLLSLVRTRAVGHLRDARRATVALSRARLGVYVFGRASLFGGCAELAPALGRLLAPGEPRLPALVPCERHGSVSRSPEDVDPPGLTIPPTPGHFAALVAAQAAEWEAAAMAAAAAGGGGGGGVVDAAAAEAARQAEADAVAAAAAAARQAQAGRGEEEGE